MGKSRRFLFMHHEAATNQHVTWDVVVVGAGPAGSTAARVASELGVSVLLLDRANFPRYKTCGGGLLGVSRSIIPASVRAVVDLEVSSVTFTHNGSRPLTITRPTPFLAMTRRDRFDAALAEAAESAGATFRPGVTVKSLSELTNGDVEISTDRGVFTSRMVVGADGVGGRVSRYVGVKPARIDLGLEDEIENRGNVTPANSKVKLDWGPGKGSYAWVFPKKGFDTVGVIEAKGSADQTRKYLAQWEEFNDYRGHTVERSSGHLTQWRDAESPLSRGNVIVAGDAAGLLEPWTREGISFALRSGELAGRAAALAVTGDSTRSVQNYEQEVESKLQPEIRVGAVLLSVFEKHPGLVHWLLRHSRRARDFFIKFCAGEKSLGDLEKHRWFMIAVQRLT